MKKTYIRIIMSIDALNLVQKVLLAAMATARSEIKDDLGSGINSSRLDEYTEAVRAYSMLEEAEATAARYETDKSI